MLNSSSACIVQEVLLQEVYSDNVMSHTRVPEWYKRFSGGLESAEYNEQPGRGRLGIQMIADMVRIDKGLYNQWSMHKVCNKVVPKDLSSKQKTLDHYMWRNADNSHIIKNEEREKRKVKATLIVTG